MSDLTFGFSVHRPVKIQIISRYIPVENTQGNCNYLLDFMRYLRKEGCELDFILLDPSPNGKIPFFIIPLEVSKLANVSARSNFRLGRVLLRINSLFEWLLLPIRLPYNLLIPKIIRNFLRSWKEQIRRISGNLVATDTFGTRAKPEEVSFTRAQVIRFKPDVLVANYAYLGDVLEQFSSDQTILKVILTHDILYQRSAQINKNGVTSPEPLWEKEQETLQLLKAQVLLAIQEVEAETIKQMVPQREVISMPISAVCRSHSTSQLRGRCLFVGGAAVHNTLSIIWFLEDVWPIILKLAPYCNLHICGNVCDEIKKKFPRTKFQNVCLLGKVNNLEPEYGNAEVCLVPLVVGSGLKIKLVEALSNGRACVSTSTGVQGLNEIIGKAALVADTAEDFAAAVHVLLTNPDRRQWMEEQAHKYVKEKLSSEAVYQPFVSRIYQHLQQKSDNLCQVASQSFH